MERIPTIWKSRTPRHLPSFAPVAGPCPVLDHQILLGVRFKKVIQKNLTKTWTQSALEHLKKDGRLKQGAVVGLLLLEVIFRFLDGMFPFFVGGGGEVENPLPKYEQAKNKLLLSGGFKHFYKKITPIWGGRMHFYWKTYISIGWLNHQL